MSLSILITTHAENDLFDARSWYERQREGLGEDFIQQVDAAFERIIRIPLAGS
jgi:hypothetical protein